MVQNWKFFWVFIWYFLSCRFHAVEIWSLKRVFIRMLLARSLIGCPISINLKSTLSYTSRWWRPRAPIKVTVGISLQSLPLHQMLSRFHKNILWWNCVGLIKNMRRWKIWNQSIEYFQRLWKRKVIWCPLIKPRVTLHLYTRNWFQVKIRSF